MHLNHFGSIEGVLRSVEPETSRSVFYDEGPRVVFARSIASALCERRRAFPGKRRAASGFASYITPLISQSEMEMNEYIFNFNIFVIARARGFRARSNLCPLKVSLDKELNAIEFKLNQFLLAKLPKT